MSIYSVKDTISHITDHTLPPEGREAFGIDAAEDIKEMDADCVVMADSCDAFKDISLSVLKGVMNSDPVLIDIMPLHSESQNNIISRLEKDKDSYNRSSN